MRDSGAVWQTIDHSAMSAPANCCYYPTIKLADLGVVRSSVALIEPIIASLGYRTRIRSKLPFNNWRRVHFDNWGRIHFGNWFGSWRGNGEAEERRDNGGGETHVDR